MRRAVVSDECQTYVVNWFQKELSISWLVRVNLWLFFGRPGNEQPCSSGVLRLFASLHFVLYLPLLFAVLGLLVGFVLKGYEDLQGLMHPAYFALG